MLISSSIQSATTSPVAVTGIFFAMGIITLKLENPGNPFTAAQLATVPWPYFDGDSDWLWHRHFAFGVRALNNFDINITTVLDDIKSRRVIPNGSGLALISYFEISPGSVATYIHQFSARILVANH